MGRSTSFLLIVIAVIFYICDGQVDLEALIARQEQQLSKLEELVDSLSRSVAKIESYTRPPSPISEPVDSKPESLDLSAPNGRAIGGLAVTKYKPSWVEKFKFLAAVKLEKSVTCVNVLPYEDHEGLAKYFAVGLSDGMVYVFSSVGDVVIENFVPSGYPITAMASYFNVGKNESFLFVAHGDGSVARHRIWESFALNGDDLLASDLGSTSTQTSRFSDIQGGPVVGLEVHQIGRMRFIVASDESGRIQVFKENGKLHGTAIASGKILAFMKQKMVFLTETTAGWLDLKRMTVRETRCEGLNGSVAKGYAFDAAERSRAYGLTLAGELIHIMLLGDAGSLKCRVRAARKTDIYGPVAIHSLKGYLLVANKEKVFLFNVSTQYYGRVVAPRPLFSATLEDIRTLFVNHDVSSDGSEMPHISGDHEKLVILGLGGGFLGTYQSNFPVFRLHRTTTLWTTPILLFLMFLLGIWFFTVKKRESLGLNPEESFSPTAGASGSLLGSAGASGDRGFIEDSRSGEASDGRTSVLRGSSRKYASSSRFASGSSIPFRLDTPEAGLRGATELKLLRPLEPPGFPKRREGIFTANQVVDEHTD